MIRNTAFSQLLQLLSRYEVKRSVDRYSGDKYTKRFNCWQQLIVLLSEESGVLIISKAMHAPYTKNIYPLILQILDIDKDTLLQYAKSSGNSRALEINC